MKSLSIRQQRFLTTYVQIGNATEAAARAGYGRTRASQAVQGSRLRKRLRFVMESSENGSIRSPEDLMDSISGYLLTISTATPEKITARDRIKALELLARLWGLLDPPPQKTYEMNYFDVRDANPQQLWAKLQEIQTELEASPIDETVSLGSPTACPPKIQTGNTERVEEAGQHTDEPTGNKETPEYSN